MSLIIRFLPSEIVSIAGIEFSIASTPSSLTRHGYAPLLIDKEGVSPLPRVQVRLAPRQHAGYLALAFQAR